MIDLDALTIREASRLLRERAFSAVELVEATLRRLEETEPLVHAYAQVTAEHALATARQVDREGPRGPLHGIPVGIKDVLATRDAPTAAGSRLLAGFMPGEDATVVRRLREAGAIVIGKHVTHEFACGQDVPPTRNPWDLRHYPGGSSAGGGVSVAVGSSLAALGTDAGGSVRKPAAVTATVGLKPTHGRVSGRGTLRTASAPSLDHVGAFTRTVEDAALVLGVIAGRDPADRRTLDEPVPDYQADLARGVAGLRLGLAPGYFAGGGLDPEVGALVEAALGEFERLGATLVTVELPSFSLALPAGFTILMVEVAQPHRRWLAERPDGYGAETRRLLELGLLLPAAHLAAAHRARMAMRAEVRAAFRDARLDALVTPTLPITSMPLDGMVVARDLPRLIPFTLPWNLTGLPALTVPCGFTRAGLPAGLQVVGRPFAEAMLFRIGHAYERATPWHRRRPALAGARGAPGASESPPAVATTEPYTPSVTGPR
jgi:Asp-tRNA(Asn)/Glu-tRNA(Gln) amidotransferase A subunit family amidase